MSHGEKEAVILAGEHGFPTAVSPKGDIPNLADIAAGHHGKLGFGVTREGAAAALRLLADQIDAGSVLPQEMVDATKATIDDFTLQTLTFTFATKRDRES